MLGLWDFRWAIAVNNRLWETVRRGSNCEKRGNFLLQMPSASKVGWLVAGKILRLGQSALRFTHDDTVKTHDLRRQPAIRAIAAVLKRQGSKLRVNDFERAAEQFISLVVDNGLRLAAFGIGPAPHEVEGRVRQAVDLFLHGVCSR
jgi:hypothetical protein